MTTSICPQPHHQSRIVSLYLFAIEFRHHGLSVVDVSKLEYATPPPIVRSVGAGEGDLGGEISNYERWLLVLLVIQ